MTLRKVSERAGVAIDTVRKALRDDPTIRHYLKERVLKAAEELDYHPNLIARALREKELRVVPISIIDLENPYFGSLAHDLSQSLSAHGLEPALCLGEDHLMKLGRTLSPCGSILGYGYSDEAMRTLAKREKVVSVGVSWNPLPGMGLVFLDFTDAYRNVASALKRSGRKRVVLQSNTRRWRANEAKPGKYGVAREAASKVGLKIVKHGDEDFFEDYRDIVALFTGHSRGCDAVICENDGVAVRLYAALTRLGVRVPEEVTIVGCDANLMLPGTWSIKIDTQVVAKEAVGLLLRLLDGEKNPEPRIYKPVAVDESLSPL